MLVRLIVMAAPAASGINLFQEQGVWKVQL